MQCPTSTALVSTWQSASCAACTPSAESAPAAVAISRAAAACSSLSALQYRQAAPSCYITVWNLMWKSKLVQQATFIPNKVGECHVLQVVPQCTMTGAVTLTTLSDQHQLLWLNSCPLQQSSSSPVYSIAVHQVICVRHERGHELQVQQPLSKQCLSQECPQQMPACKNPACCSSRKTLHGRCFLEHPSHSCITSLAVRNKDSTLRPKTDDAMEMSLQMHSLTWPDGSEEAGTPRWPHERSGPPLRRLCCNTAPHSTCRRGGMLQFSP